MAVIAPGFHANASDPFVPYWRDHVADLAQHVDVTVFPLRVPAAARPYRVFGADVVPLGHGDVRLRRSPQLWRDAVSAVATTHRRAPFDLVHALNTGEAGMVGAFAALTIRRPLLAHVAGGELVRLPAIGYGANTTFERLAATIALQSARVVTTGSGAMLALARRRLGAHLDRARLAPLGVRANRFLGLRSSGPRSTDRLEILSVANLNRVKDHATLFRALAALPTDLRAARLSLVGFGPCAGDLWQLARTLGIADRVRWWGAVPHGAVHLAYARADVFASSARHEAQGIALIEAALCGLPVAATSVGVAADLEAPTLHRVRAGQPTALASALAAAAAHGPSDGDRLADIVAAEYDLATCTRRFLGAYAAASAR